MTYQPETPSWKVRKLQLEPIIYECKACTFATPTSLCTSLSKGLLHLVQRQNESFCLASGRVPASSMWKFKELIEVEGLREIHTPESFSRDGVHGNTWHPGFSVDLEAMGMTHIANYWYDWRLVGEMARKVRASLDWTLKIAENFG